MITLYDYQQEAYDNIRAAYSSSYRAPILQLPTGGGKTVFGAHVIAKTVAKGKRVLVLVHRIELLRQWVKAAESNGVYPGIINPKYRPNKMAMCQVASVQTLVKRLADFGKFDLIIIDECHHAMASTYLKIVQHYNTRLLGVTATPHRSDGKGLGIDHGGIFDYLISGPSVAELIRRGKLVKPIIYLPPTDVDLSGVGSVAGDYNKGQLSKAMDKPSITGDAVAQYTKICPGTPAVAFCVDVAHANHVAAAFRAAGYRAEAVDGKTDDDERKRILDGLGNGSVQVVTSCDIISEGTDIPAIGAVILLRPTKSLVLFLQQVGRALRTLPGKSHAVVLDHVGNVGKYTSEGFVPNHGTPDQDRVWSLDGDVEKKKRIKQSAEAEQKAIQCEMCYALNETRECQQCGHINQLKQRKGPKLLDGELRVLSADEVAANIAKKERNMSVGRARTREELEHIAKMYGYKPGWVEVQLQLKQKRGIKI